MPAGRNVLDFGRTAVRTKKMQMELNKDHLGRSFSSVRLPVSYVACKYIHTQGPGSAVRYSVRVLSVTCSGRAFYANTLPARRSLPPPVYLCNLPENDASPHGTSRTLYTRRSRKYAYLTVGVCRRGKKYST